MQLLDTRRARPDQRGGNNGGFPKPPDGEPVHVVDHAHQACGAATRIRLPQELPATVVRRVVCGDCHQSFEAPAEQAVTRRPTAFAALAAAMPGLHGTAVRPALGDAVRSASDLALDWAESVRERGADLLEPVREWFLGLPLPEISRSRLWAWASMPLALLCVIAGLALLRGDSSVAGQPTIQAPSSAVAGATLIENPGYTLVLPSGWKQTEPPSGAVFAAQSKDGMADATLWIEREPNLSFKDFERRSLEQLGGLGENARVADRVTAPTIEGTIADLRADTPIAGGVTAPYRVTLRAAGPYRHYFATLQQPGANPKVLGDIELMHNSLRPEVKQGGNPGSTP